MINLAVGDGQKMSKKTYVEAKKKMSSKFILRKYEIKKKIIWLTAKTRQQKFFLNIFVHLCLMFFCLSII